MMLEMNFSLITKVKLNKFKPNTNQKSVYKKTNCQHKLRS